jgi:DNA-binding IclR family transcriptional regulator
VDVPGKVVYNLNYVKPSCFICNTGSATVTEVQTLARGLQVLELLVDSEGGLTTTELAGHIGIDKSGMSRLMGTLEKYRYAERDGRTRRYFLGTHVQELGRRAGRHILLRRVAEPHLRQLGERTAENAHVAVVAGVHALTIADVPSTEALRVVSEVGRRLPLHCSATGKCLLAFSGGPLPADLPRFTDATIVEADTLERHLGQIRRHGHALDDEELTLGVRGLAVPIRNREGRTVAAMGLSGPTVRLTTRSVPDLVRSLRRAAADTSAELGYRAS